MRPQDEPIDGGFGGGRIDVYSLPEGTYILTRGVLILEGSTVLRGYGTVVKRPDGEVAPWPHDPLVRFAPAANAVIKGVTFIGSRPCSSLVNEGNLVMIDGSLTGNYRSIPAQCPKNSVAYDSGAAFDNVGTATLLRTSLTNNGADILPSAFTNSGRLRIIKGVITGNSSILFMAPTARVHQHQQRRPAAGGDNLQPQYRRGFSPEPRHRNHS